MVMLCELPGAEGEEWMFESRGIEDDGHWRTTTMQTRNLDRLIGQHALGRRAPPGEKRGGRADTALRFLMAASDPVNAVSGGSEWRADAALREFAARTKAVSDSTVSAVALDDPDSDGGRRVFSDLCSALGVGLIVGRRGFRVVKICEEKNIWLERRRTGPGWAAAPWCPAPVGAATARSLIAHKAGEVATDEGATMHELREIAEAFGIPRPLPRTKKLLAGLIIEHLGPKAG